MKVNIKFQLMRLAALMMFFLVGQTSMAFKVVGYVPYWTQTTIQYSKLTHINYAFALPQYGGRLKPINNPGYLQSIVANAHANGVKVFIAIGGWSDNGVVLDPVFESIGGSPSARANFINDALYLVNTYKLDGVDIDWEYPNSGSSSTNFTTLMRELSSALRSRGKGLSFATAADAYSASGIQSAVFQYVDFVNIMAYDAQGSHHSTYQFAVDALNLYKGKGCPAGKCVVGVPFYARPSWRSYSQLLAAGASPNSDWFGSDGYNGIPTIKKKTQMALNQAGGIMIWELSQDVQGANSLLNAINEVVKSSNNNNTGGVATVYKDCSYGGYAKGLPVGNYTLSALTSRGILNDDISSLKVNSGYEVQLFEHDNFTGASITLRGDNSCLVGNGWNDRATSLRVRQVSTVWSRTIQAENYSTMLGVQKENTSDAGGGQNVGWIDAGDWMAYNSINIPNSGTYRVSYRVASQNGGGRLSLDLNAGAIQLGALNVPSTGGWQTWTTISHNVYINAGTYNFGIYAHAGGFNINWFSLTRISGKYEAEISDVVYEKSLMFDYTTDMDLDFYPNPATEYMVVKSAYDLIGSEYRIYDEMGVEVANSILTENALDLSSLGTGLYTMIIYSNGTKFGKRFIKE